VGIVVTWRIENTAKAMFGVENYHEYLSVISDYALRSTIRAYPYDASDEEEGVPTLRSASEEIAEKLRSLIAEKMDIAGIEILEARITSLSYAPEIAQAMLQRQQATAVVAARQLIVEGAMGMVEMALQKLQEEGVVALDEERKATMVANLLVVLCANRESSSVVNTQAV